MDIRCRKIKYDNLYKKWMKIVFIEMKSLKSILGFKTFGRNTIVEIKGIVEIELFKILELSIKNYVLILNFKISENWEN